MNHEEHLRHEHNLQYWFDFSGETMEQFIADVERWQPSADLPGLHPEIAAEMMNDPNLAHHQKIVIFRAMQHLVATRPWRKPEQLSLF